MMDLARHGLISTLDADGNGPAVAVKDSIDIAGQVTGLGVAFLAGGAPSERDAACVASLRGAGFRIVGKAALHPLALGATGLNRWQGTPLNARFPDRVPGGSSSGSAALVGAGIVDLAIGTDTGGSVRVPAACCGVLGLKTSAGLIDRTGVYPPESSLDCIGFFANDATLIARAVRACARSSLSPATGGTVGVLSTGAPTSAAVDSMLYRAGFDLRPVALPGFAAAFDAAFILLAAEAWLVAGKWTGRGLLPPDVEERVLAGREVSAADLAEAEATRANFRAEVDRALAGLDAIALPTLAEPPPTLMDGERKASGVGLTRHVRPFNLSGHPAISVPLRSATDVPVSVQLVGHINGDLALCSLAQLLLEPGSSVPTPKEEFHES